MAVDDASRLAYTEVLADERKKSACAFLTRALTSPPTASASSGS